ncbi:16398_t:CDS:2 [Racocetra fulgida]|uniref:16398_t:CDS:1 n=1 Tax=Racocetra fulgida TaxID=60492 RepID=A0A9N9F4M8_9GLOM|nr:16398_t:CDS:2 [Racocetra fulgida]
MKLDYSIDSEEPSIDDNNDKLIDELYADIEALNFLNVMDLEEFIDYPEIVELATNIESVENENAEEEDNSTKMCQISHQEAFNAIETFEYYIMQNDFSKRTQLEHDEALLNLQKEIRKLQIASFKQVLKVILSWFELWK